MPWSLLPWYSCVDEDERSVGRPTSTNVPTSAHKLDVLQLILKNAQTPTIYSYSIHAAIHAVTSI